MSVLAGSLLLAPTLLLMPPYLHVQRELGLRAHARELGPGAGQLPGLTDARCTAAILSRVTQRRRSTRRRARSCFPGICPLSWAPRRCCPAFAGQAGETLFFAALTVARRAARLRDRRSGCGRCVYWLPGFNFIRIPSRFILLAVLGVAVLAASDSIASVARRAPRVAPGRDRTRVGMLLVAEFWMVPLPVVPYQVEIPAVDRWLDTQPKPFAIAEVPVRPLVRYHSTYMLHSMAHWQRTVHGHSSLLTPLHEQLYDELRTFPDARSVAHLAELGVTYVVVHTIGTSRVNGRMSSGASVPSAPSLRWCTTTRPAASIEWRLDGRRRSLSLHDSAGSPGCWR